MRVFVWVVSVLLVVAFVLTGVGKLVSSSADLSASAGGVPVVLFRIAGVAEVAGAVGLVLPVLTRTLVWLTPLAAWGLVITMTGAVIVNVVLGEYVVALVPLVLGLLSGFVAWTRRVPGPLVRSARAERQHRSASA